MSSLMEQSKIQQLSQALILKIMSLKIVKPYSSDKQKEEQGHSYFRIQKKEDRKM